MLNHLLMFQASRKAAGAEVQGFMGQHHIHLSELNTYIHNPVLNIVRAPPSIIMIVLYLTQTWLALSLIMCPPVKV